MRLAALAIVLGACELTPAPAPRAHHEPAAAVATPPPAPDAPQATPAAMLLHEWLDAFNSADEARVRTFVTERKFPRGADEMLQFRQQTGGFDLVQIDKDDRLAVTFTVKEKGSPTTAVGWLTVKDAMPPEIATFDIQAIPPGKTAADVEIKVDAATRMRVIDAIASKLTDFYVYPDVAKAMIAAMREHQKAGAYDAINNGRTFATQLTDDLRAVSHDGHLRIDAMPEAPSDDQAEPSAADKARRRVRLEQVKCGFETAEKLDGNIGYIKFNMFAEVDICGPKASAAFAAIGDVDAVIFDLRGNGGGEPEMVAYIASYLFAKRTHINDIYDRPTNKTTQFWTKPDVPGKKLAKQPVYILTSHRTFSGAEEFCYDLQNLKRATIVGETTGGGAHPTAGKRLDDHFMIGVPTARAISPITHTDWEGTGIEPDVKVPAAEALDRAKQLAAERLHKR